TLVTRDAAKFWDIEGVGATQYEEFEDARPRFTLAEYRQLASLAARHDVVFFTTPSDEAWADVFDDLGAPLFKVASMDITHVPLLRHIARKCKPVILSTGASSLDEIGAAVEI